MNRTLRRSAVKSDRVKQSTAAKIGLASMLPLLAVGLFGAAPTANAAPAGPDSGTSRIAYNVDTDDVCREQFQRSDAYARNVDFKFDNYSLQCFGRERGAGFPWNIAVSSPQLGNLYIQEYCDDFYPGSVAKDDDHWADPKYNWYCVYG